MPDAGQRKRKPRVEFWRLRRVGQITPEEAECVAVALRFMVTKVGGQQELAYRMGIDRTAVRRALKGKPPPGIGIAFEVARIVGVPVEDVLAGRFPAPGDCPMCGGHPFAGVGD
jgi:DNA-binding XRE family transcriptional regulator